MTTKVILIGVIVIVAAAFYTGVLSGDCSKMPLISDYLCYMRVKG